MDDQVQRYLDLATTRFSGGDVLYQGIPGGSVKSTRDCRVRWETYKISGLKGKSILDIGCNLGGFSACVPAGVQSYLGIDVDPETIKLAQYLYDFSYCSFEVKSFNDLHGVTYDVVLALAVRRYTGLSFEDFATAVAKLLPPGGRMFYESHSGEQWGSKPRAGFSKSFVITRHLTVPARTEEGCEAVRYFLELHKR